jgi:DNA-binding MarR family transcriptional regulator
MNPSLQQEIHKLHPFDTPEQEAYLNLIRTQQQLAVLEDQFMRQHGLSGPKYNVLRILRGIGGEGAPCSVIRDRMITRVPDITRLIDRLERDGLVTRHRVPHDRRLVLVRLTSHAEDVLARMDAPLLELHRRQLGHMTRDDLKALTRLLEVARSGPGTVRSEPCPADNSLECDQP